MIVRNDIKKYIGAIEDENKAALFYDKYAMIIQGYEVRNQSTHFLNNTNCLFRRVQISPTRRTRCYP